MDLPDKAIGCHRTGFTKKCRALVVNGTCNRWKHLPMADPVNAGQVINKFDCLDNWTFQLLLENAKLQRETGAAVESHRNVNHAVNQVAISALEQLVKAAQSLPALPPAQSTKLIEG